MSGAGLAILAGQGALPQILARTNPDALFVSFKGAKTKRPANPHYSASFERLGSLFETLRSHKISSVVFAGAMSRPTFDPKKFDGKMKALAPRLTTAMAGGDDGLLREVVAIFEEEGFKVLGPHQVVPDLLVDAGLLAGPSPTEVDLSDAARGIEILTALGPVDVGQGVVVAGGLCLGIETLQGTDAMLKFVAQTPGHLIRSKGVFVKAPKPAQDLRIDMPVIGPDTVVSVANAGLGGIVIWAGRVMLLERAKVIKSAEAAGLFLLAL